MSGKMVSNLQGESIIHTCNPTRPPFCCIFLAFTHALLQVLNPAYDYIPPNLVDLYVTNQGGLQPSYIYRQLADYYHRDDLIISPSHEL